MDKYVAYLLLGQCFLSFIIENLKGLLAVLDWQLPSSSGGRRWLLWYVGSTWEASGMAWIHQLPQETQHRDPAPPQGGERWVGAVGPPGSLAEAPGRDPVPRCPWLLCPFNAGLGPVLSLLSFCCSFESN